jgi:hypothetical protein
MDNSEKDSEYRVEDIVVSERTGFTMGSSNEAVTLEYEAETLDRGSGSSFSVVLSWK